MSKLRAQLRNIVKSDEGATMVEYALMIVLIAVVSITIVTTLGGQISQAFTAVSTAF